ncbi:hypothetical protein HXX76_007826 [Chlamydomonas incerta]|uniref:lipoyl(octanoyl) transferase n=1 Tax=Chlamydomonas incerta TaxID=51695 RepID=A0A835W209_CHLIN|nr:hypothetical protein HXX76_007826 [Chlamydomonas incerta]|eukprot:KAG2434099.1 hypothetical protein HXX76_007826 [Chlamydomonas incerta]
MPARLLHANAARGASSSCTGGSMTGAPVAAACSSPKQGAFCCSRGSHTGRAGAACAAAAPTVAATANARPAAAVATCRTRRCDARALQLRVACAAGSAAEHGGPSTDAAVGGAGRVVVYDLSDQVVEYETAWAWQRALLARATAAADAGQRGSCHAAILLQHPPVYTLGTGSTLDHLRFPPGAPPIPLYRTERGGEVTYHGPGQLVLYPILDLQSPPLRPDLHWYLRQLEQVIIEALEAVSGLAGGREEGLTGVWVEGAKVAAIGVKAKRWVTFHGLALNVVADLAPFRTGLIVPCGIADRPVTSVAELLAAAAAAEDPFAGVAAGPALAGAGAAASGEMIPIAEATQEDLRRMLAAAGMSPLVITESPPPGAGGDSASPSGNAAAWDSDDPFAPAADDPFAPVAPESAGTLDAAGRAPGAPDDAPPSPSGGSHSSGGRPWSVRSEWSEAERLLLREYSCALLAAVEDVFGLVAVAGDVAELEALAEALVRQEAAESVQGGRERGALAVAEPR